MTRTMVSKRVILLTALILVALACVPALAGAQVAKGRSPDIIVHTDKQFDAKPVDPLKEGIRVNVERLARANATFETVHNDLLSHNDGSPTWALKINLVALKMCDTRADLILPTITMLDEYRVKILADSGQNDLLEKRSRLDAARSERGIDKLAGEVIEAKLAVASPGSAETRALEEEIDDKTDEIKNLIEERDDNTAKAEAFAETNRADREELESLKAVYRQLSQMTRSERYYAERLRRAAEQSGVQMGRQERSETRVDLERSLNLLTHRTRLPDVVNAPRPGGDTIPLKTAVDPLPRKPLDERVVAELKKAEARRKIRATPGSDRLSP